MNKRPSPCHLCGARRSRKTCGLLPHLGQCGQPDESVIAEETHALMSAPAEIGRNLNDPLAAARAALAMLKRCGAHARSTGQPCKRVPVKGRTRCLFHGGRSTGPRPTSGKRTLYARRNKHWLRTLLRVVAASERPIDPVDPPEHCGDLRDAVV